MEGARNTISDTEAGLIVQAGTIHGDVHLPGPPAQLAPHQLPASTRHFTGREEEQRRLTEIVDGMPTSAGTICTMDGPPGIGKTALMVHWAHQVKTRFPDGQIYLDLRGFDPRLPPVEPEDAVRAVLEALQGLARPVPKDLDARSALLRSLTDDRRMLLLIDNARDSRQALPLLPGAAGCLTLVAGRERLDALTARHGAHRLRLGLLSVHESRGLLSAYVGSARVSQDPRAADSLGRRCAWLPLALTVVAARAAAEEMRPLAEVVQEMDDEQATLDALRLPGSEETDVRLSFSLSYNVLDPQAAELFRALALHPGSTVRAAAAAALTGWTLPVARRRLGDLVRRNLVACPAPDAFVLHDLLRAFGQEMADQATDQRASLGALVNFLLHAAHRADRLINSHRRPIPLEPCARPDLLPVIADYAGAMAWFTAEYDNILAAVRLAQRERWHPYTWQLPWTLSNFAYLQARWADWIETHTAAAEAARQTGNTTVELRLWQSLGRAYSEQGSYDDARTAYENALLVLDGSTESEANALNGLAGVHARAGRHTAAVQTAQRALELYTQLGDLVGQASTRNILGRSLAGAGDPAGAVDQQERALVIYDALRDDYGRAHTNSALAEALVSLGRLRQAVVHHDAAISLYRAVGNRAYEAREAERLADVLLSLGRPTAARSRLQQAHAVLTDIGDPRAAAISTRLDHLADGALDRGSEERAP